METIKTEFAIIGGGMAGLPIANRLAYKGKKTVLFEMEKLGGTCLNRGCIPTKTTLYSAKVAHLIRRAGEFGVHVGEPEIRLDEIVKRKNRIVTSIRNGAYRQVEKNEHLTFIEARARFLDEHRIEAGDKIVEAEKIIVNVGARPMLPEIPGLAESEYFTSRTLLDEREIPDSLLVIGGGYVGVEFAQMFSRFGSRVTIVQRNKHLLPGEDPEIGSTLKNALEAEGITVLTATVVDNIKRTEAGNRLIEVRGPDETRVVESSAILVAAGRVPNTSELNIAATGITLNQSGFISVNGRFQTSSDHILAIGDVTGAPMFTHSARDDADLIYSAIIKNDEINQANRLIPHAVFTDPEIASVGLTEDEARAAGHDLKIGKMPFNRVARAMAMGETTGFIKLIADAGTDRILGAHIIGPEAGNLLHEILVAMEAGITFQHLSRIVHIHPTLAEGVNAAAGGVHRPAGEKS